MCLEFFSFWIATLLWNPWWMDLFLLRGGFTICAYLCHIIRWQSPFLFSEDLLLDSNSYNLTTNILWIGQIWGKSTKCHYCIRLSGLAFNFSYSKFEGPVRRQGEAFPHFESMSKQKHFQFSHFQCKNPSTKQQNRKIPALSRLGDLRARNFVCEIFCRTRNPWLSSLERTSCSIQPHRKLCSNIPFLDV